MLDNQNAQGTIIFQTQDMCNVCIQPMFPTNAIAICFQFYTWHETNKIMLPSVKLIYFFIYECIHSLKHLL